MKYQSTSHGCGPAALCNALACLGIDKTEAELARLAGTTKKNGTDEKGLMKAIEALGLEWVEMKNSSKFRKALMAGHPVIVIINSNEHWVTLIGRIGRKFVVADPDGSDLKKGEMGVRVVDKNEIKNFYRHYGIAVRKKT